MTIFDLLHTTPPDSPITFYHGRFYAYKELLVDLDKEIIINLTKPTKNNPLLKQLDIQRHYKLAHISESITTPIEYSSYRNNNLYTKSYQIISYKGITLNMTNDKILAYYENSDTVMIIHRTKSNIQIYKNKTLLPIMEDSTHK